MLGSASIVNFPMLGFTGLAGRRITYVMCCNITAIFQVPQCQVFFREVTSAVVLRGVDTKDTFLSGLLLLVVYLVIKTGCSFNTCCVNTCSVSFGDFRHTSAHFLTTLAFVKNLYNVLLLFKGTIILSHRCLLG